MPSSSKQLSLFDDTPTPPAADREPRRPAQTGEHVTPPIEQTRASQVNLNPHSPLSVAIKAYHDYMEKSDLSPHTVKSFLYDLNILVEFATPGRPIGQLAQRDLENFMDWLINGRGVPCNPKSLSRRLTTLKAFFRWLNDSGAIDEDPAAPIAHRPVSTPLPDVLSEQQVEQILAVTDQLRHDPDKPDPRPHLLVTLLLATGIKKSECLSIQLDHLDLSDLHEPALWIRYSSPRHLHKERKLKLDAKWPRVFEEYRQHYKVEKTLFNCTARNLEYVLADVGRLAGLPKQLSFEMLRWTCAVRDRQNGMKEETLRHKLGLSTITWHDTWPKIEKLAAPPI